MWLYSTFFGGYLELPRSWVQFLCGSLASLSCEAPAVPVTQANSDLLAACVRGSGAEAVGDQQKEEGMR
jgi:hypothetical protein